MKRLYAAAAAAGLLTLVAAAGAAAQPPGGTHTRGGPDCPVCVYGPHKDVVKHTVYGTKTEPFCLPKLSLFGLFHHGPDCPDCQPPRVKTRLVKWDVTEEKVKMKCAVEGAVMVVPVPAPTAAVPPGTPGRPVPASPLPPPGPSQPK